MKKLHPLKTLPTSQTIIDAAEELMMRLIAHYTILLPDKTPSDFVQELLNPFSLASPEEPATITFNRNDGPYRGFGKYMQHIIEALALGNTACKAYEDGNHEIAWRAMAQAYYLLGHLEGLMVVEPAAIHLNASHGKSGASIRDAKFGPLREYARELAGERNYPSRRNAALSIKDQVLARAKELKIALSGDNAEKTITKWLSDMTFTRKK